jgi:hypothetical protein
LLMLDHALRTNSQLIVTATLNLFTACCTAELQYRAAHSSGALYAGFLLREMLLRAARSLAA